MTQMDSPGDPSSHRLSGSRRAALVLVLLAGLVLLGGVGWFVFFFTHYGDTAPPAGVTVDNRTAIPLNIYVIVPGQKPVLTAFVPAQSRVATGVTCGMTEMVARDTAGHRVARRGPYPRCDETEWVIR